MLEFTCGPDNTPQLSVAIDARYPSYSLKVDEKPIADFATEVGLAYQDTFPGAVLLAAGVVPSHYHEAVLTGSDGLPASAATTDWFTVCLEEPAPTPTPTPTASFSQSPIPLPDPSVGDPTNNPTDEPPKKPPFYADPKDVAKIIDLPKRVEVLNVKELPETLRDGSRVYYNARGKKHGKPIARIVRKTKKNGTMDQKIKGGKRKGTSTLIVIVEPSKMHPEGDLFRTKVKVVKHARN